MREEKIIITIDEEGNPSIDVNGVKGKACLDLTKQLEEALGTVTKRTEKEAMKERPVYRKQIQTIKRG